MRGYGQSMACRAKDHILDILSDGKSRPIATILDDLWHRRESKQRGANATIPTTNEARYFLNHHENIEKKKQRVSDIHDPYYGRRKMHYRLLLSDDQIEMIKKQQEHMIDEDEEE